MGRFYISTYFKPAVAKTKTKGSKYAYLETAVSKYTYLAPGSIFDFFSKRGSKYSSATI